MGRSQSSPVLGWLVPQLPPEKVGVVPVELPRLLPCRVDLVCDEFSDVLVSFALSHHWRSGQHRALEVLDVVGESVFISLDVILRGFSIGIPEVSNSGYPAFLGVAPLLLGGLGFSPEARVVVLGSPLVQGLILIIPSGGLVLV